MKRLRTRAKYSDALLTKDITAAVVRIEVLERQLAKAKEQRNGAMTLNWTKTTDEKIQAVIDQDDAELEAIASVGK